MGYFPTSDNIRIFEIGTADITWVPYEISVVEDTFSKLVFSCIGGFRVQGTCGRHDSVSNLQGIGDGGGVRAEEGPVPADGGRAAAAAAPGRGGARQLRGAAHLVASRCLPRAHPRNWSD